MGAWIDAPVTPPFRIRHDWPTTVIHVIYLPSLNRYLLMEAPSVDHQGLKKPR